MDYGKHIFAKKKISHLLKENLKNTVKEINLGIRYEGDYNIKLKKIKSFILDGTRLK